jgi:hypothetical protein
MGITALAGGGVLMAASSDSSQALSFHSTQSTRLLDTRPDTKVGDRVTPLGAQETMDLLVPGLPSDATAVSINVTVVNGTEGSFLTVFPKGDVRPGTSTINWHDAEALANTATVNVHSDHTLSIFNLKGTVDVVIDLMGYYAPSPSGSGGQTGPQGPQGPEGPEGPEGPQGPAGRGDFLYAFNNSPVGMDTGGTMTFDTVGAQSGITSDISDPDPATLFTVTNDGVYRVEYEIVTAVATPESQFVIQVDSIDTGFIFGGEGRVNTGTAVLMLQAGDTISVVNGESGAGAEHIEVGADLYGGQGNNRNAWITIEQIGDQVPV